MLNEYSFNFFKIFDTSNSANFSTKADKIKFVKHKVAFVVLPHYGGVLASEFQSIGCKNPLFVIIRLRKWKLNE